MENELASTVSLRLIVLRTHNVSELVSFYRSLGLEFIEERHGSGPLHYSAQLTQGILEIYPLSDGETVDTSTRLGFEVHEPDEVVRSVSKTAGSVMKPGRETPWGYCALVADPDGRTIELYRS